MKYRYYVSDVKSLKQPYQYFETGLFWSCVGLVASLNMNDLIPFFRFSKFFRNQLTGITFLAVICCLVGYLITNRFRERVPTIRVGHMDVKAKWVAWQVRNSFNVRNIIDVLGFDNQTPYGFSIPVIKVYVDNSYNSGWVAIENMATSKTLDDDKTLKRLSGVLKSRFVQRFSFVNCDFSKDGNFYIYHFEDMKTSKRFIVKNGNIEPFVSDNDDDVRLAKNLVWHTRITAHLSVIARTRGGKSTFTGSYLIPLLLKQRWRVYLFSPKIDKYIEKYNGESNPIKIIEKLEQLENEMKHREVAIAKAGKDNSSQMPSMPNVAIILDEIARMNSFLEDKDNKELLNRWNSVTKALTGSGASSGFHVIAMSQRSTKDGFFKSPTAVTNVADAVIMLGLAADSGKDRETLMAGFELPRRNYGCGQGIARIISSGNEWEQPHYYETPLIVN